MSYPNKVRDDLMERLCKLATLVGGEIYHDKHAHDCFCARHYSDPKDYNLPAAWNFQFSPQIIEFIEKAVLKAIDGQKHCPGCDGEHLP